MIICSFKKKKEEENPGIISSRDPSLNRLSEDQTGLAPPAAARQGPAWPGSWPGSSPSSEDVFTLEDMLPPGTRCHHGIPLAPFLQNSDHGQLERPGLQITFNI